MYAVRIVKSVVYFDTIVKRLRSTHSEHSGYRMLDQVIVELWKHRGDSERYVLTIYNQDARLPEFAASIMDKYGVEIAKDIDKWVEKERGLSRGRSLGR